MEVEIQNLNTYSLNGPNQSSFFRIIRPYLIISLVGVLAFAPVSFMLKALKNDIVAIEYPINYFISQCIHNGEKPYWFNTWGMGFPLQSNLTWGIYSTPRILFSSLFNYNIYTLHVEFMFFLLLSGWTMFYLLKKYLVDNQKTAQVMAICYMLSGFMVGSSQWLLYITAAAFIPLVISSLLQLLHSPSSRNAMQFALVYFLMFTSVYAAFNIITTYGLVIFLITWFVTSGKDKQEKLRTLRYTGLAGILTLLVCFPCLYYTIELLEYMDRGDAIINSKFFNSNYLHPAALSNVLFPFASTKMAFENTEGTMLDVYTGLFTLVFLLAAILQTIKRKNQAGIILLIASLLFLIFAFGAMTPLRNVLNMLPGFSYFRNPAIFRLYFIILLITYLGVTFRNFSWNELFTSGKQGRIITFSILALMIFCLATLLFNIRHLQSFSFNSLSATIKSLSYEQAIAINSFIQLSLLGVLLFSVINQHYRLAGIVVIADLVINTIICTPYFTVSSYSLPRINQILHSEKGFPVQQEKVNEAATVFVDENMNTWQNTNVYKKLVSSNDSYRGPLYLKQSPGFPNDSVSARKLFNHPIVFAGNDSTDDNTKLNITLQRPTHVRIYADLPATTTVTLMQNYFPGWKAFYNNEQVEFINKDTPGLTIPVAGGNAIIDFKYEKKGVWLSALLLHILMISFFAFRLFLYIKSQFFRRSSLS